MFYAEIDNLNESQRREHYLFHSQLDDFSTSGGEKGEGKKRTSTQESYQQLLLERGWVFISIR